MTALGARWRELAHRHPWTLRLAWGAALVLLAGDLFLVGKRVNYARETARLRAGMTAVERARIDAALQSDSNRMMVMIELARRQASVDAGLHLSVALDSGVLTLEQEGATLRTVRAEVGPDVWVHTSGGDSLRITAPRGTRTIERVVDDTMIVLNGGAVIYAESESGASPARAGAVRAGAVRAGAVRVSAIDFRAIQPSLRAGQRVYFF